MRHRQRLIRRNRASGVSLVELLVVASILMVVGALAVPAVIQTVEGARFTSNAQDLASFYQKARMLAITDNTYYNVQNVSGSNPAIYFIDLDGDGTSANAAGRKEPVLQLAAPVSVDNTNAPAGLDLARLGFTPFQVETSTMFTQNGQNHPGLAFNNRGLPCQRASTTTLCTNVGVGWVQYLQYNRVRGGVAWAAVVVTPAARIRVYKYNGKGWF
jgi:Tfp pilus assembly protein FimT